MLLTGTLLTFLPGILVAMIEAVVGNRLPTVVFTALWLLCFYSIMH